jgi:hypothetical protein
MVKKVNVPADGPLAFDYQVWPRCLGLPLQPGCGLLGEERLETFLAFR